MDDEEKMITSIIEFIVLMPGFLLLGCLLSSSIDIITTIILICVWAVCTLVFMIVDLCVFSKNMRT